MVDWTKGKLFKILIFPELKYPHRLQLQKAFVEVSKALELVSLKKKGKQEWEHFKHSDSCEKPIKLKTLSDTKGIKVYCIFMVQQSLQSHRRL